MADIDAVLERLVSDSAFRAQLSSDPAAALAGYDLSAEDLQLLAGSIDDSVGGQRGVEQRTSKSAVVGLLASLTGGGGGGGGGGGKGQASDFLAPPAKGQSPEYFAPTGNQSGDSHLEIDGIKGENAPSDGAATWFKAPDGNLSGGSPDEAAGYLKIAPADISGNLAPNDQGLASAADIFAKVPSSSASDFLAPAGNLSGVSPDESGISTPALPGKPGPSGGSGIDIGGAADWVKIGNMKGEASPAAQVDYFAPTGGSGSDISSYGHDTKIPVGLQGDAAVQGNLAPDRGNGVGGVLHEKTFVGPEGQAAVVGNTAPGQEGARKIDIPAMKAGDTSVDLSQMKAGDTSVVTERTGVATGDLNGDGLANVNGDSGTSELIGLLAPAADKAPSLEIAPVDVFTVEDA